MYGVLLNKKQDDQIARQVGAWCPTAPAQHSSWPQVLLDMEEEERFHPALLRLQRGSGAEESEPPSMPAVPFYSKG